MPLPTKKDVLNSLNPIEKKRAAMLFAGEKASYAGTGIAALGIALHYGPVALAVTAMALVPGYCIGLLQDSPCYSAAGQEAFSKIRNFRAKPLSLPQSLVEGIKVGLIKDNPLKYSAKMVSPILIILTGLAIASAYTFMPKAGKDKFDGWMEKRKPGFKKSRNNPSAEP